MTEFRGGPAGQYFADDDPDWMRHVQADYKRRQSASGANSQLDGLRYASQEELDRGKRIEAFARQEAEREAEYRALGLSETDADSALGTLGRRHTLFHREDRP